MNNVKNGFTLIEVLIAVAMVGLLLSPLFIAQESIFINVVKRARNFERIIKAKNFYWSAKQKADKQEKPEFTLDKKLDDPVMTLKYEVTPQSQKSALKNFKDVYKERVKMTWQDGRRKREDALVSFVFKPQPQKKQ